MATGQCKETITTLNGKTVWFLDCDGDGYIGTREVDKIEIESALGKRETKPINIFLDSVGLESGLKLDADFLAGFVSRLDSYSAFLNPENKEKKLPDSYWNFRPLAEWCRGIAKVKVCKFSTPTEWARLLLTPVEAKRRADRFVQKVIDGVHEFLYVKNSVDEQALVILPREQGDEMKEELNRFLKTAEVLYQVAGQTPPEGFAIAQLRYGAFKMTKGFIDEDVREKVKKITVSGDSWVSDLYQNAGSKKENAVELRFRAPSFYAVKEGMEEWGKAIKSRSRAYYGAIKAFEDRYPKLAEIFKTPRASSHYDGILNGFDLAWHHEMVSGLSLPWKIFCNSEGIKDGCPFLDDSFTAGPFLVAK